MNKNFNKKVKKSAENAEVGTKKSIPSSENDTQDIYLKKDMFIQDKKESILKRYSFANVILHHIQKLGCGAFGSVYKATLIGTDIVRAIKIIEKDKVSEPKRLVMEMSLMRQLDHPNLVKLYETYETENEIYLVMEYCEGG